MVHSNMKNLKEKYRLWKYKNSPAFQSALGAANKEQVKVDYLQIKSTKQSSTKGVLG